LSGLTGAENQLGTFANAKTVTTTTTSTRRTSKCWSQQQQTNSFLSLIGYQLLTFGSNCN
jgi:hypothetical protein